MNAPTRSGTVVTLGKAGPDDPRNHEAVTRRQIALGLAALKGFEFGGEYEPSLDYARPLYFVPADTLVEPGHARRLPIRSEHDLYGGVVPHAFAATKAITHPLIKRGRAPEGWSPGFAKRVEASVLCGYTAFDRADARRAGVRLLERGSVRIKRSRGVAGRGQWTIGSADALCDVLDSLDDAEIASSGVVVEEDLADVTTYSVGQVRVADIVASYWGTQRLTRDHHGDEVYGGSELVVVRGGFDALEAHGPPADVGRAIADARVYDAAADACFDGFCASRRNYDVARGTDARGQTRSGVLEQSWRIGGASGAEIVALSRLAREPTLRAVRVATVEVHAEVADVPATAFVLFRGVDPRIGPLTKYVVAEAGDDSR
jgi:hypothetical protein